MEKREFFSGKIEGITEKKRKNGDVKVTEIQIESDAASKKLSKPKGKYITVSFPTLESPVTNGIIKKEIISALGSLLPENRENVLVVGLGNAEITPDCIGPKTAGLVLATRHIAGETAEKIGLKGIKSVAAIAPNVLGKTGIEASELVAAAVEKIKPSAVIVIDALASSGLDRLFTTVQLCNTGISPGSGVKNARKELSEKQLGVPVIAVGIPTVADVSKEVCTQQMIITPKNVDLLCDKASELLALSVNCFLQPRLDEETLLSLV